MLKKCGMSVALLIQDAIHKIKTTDDPLEISLVITADYIDMAYSILTFMQKQVIQIRDIILGDDEDEPKPKDEKVLEDLQYECSNRKHYCRVNDDFLKDPKAFLIQILFHSIVYSSRNIINGCFDNCHCFSTCVTYSILSMSHRSKAIAETT